MTKNTAVLIFANTSQKELNEKAIPSLELFEKLNSKVLTTVQKSGFPYFLITENEQKGNSFGERFTNAIEAIFQQGFENIITVGNDTPQLSKAHLQKTFQLFQQKKIVLGPSQDGGFYLLGIQQKYFDKKQFLKLPWQTSRLSAYVQRLLKRSAAEIERLQVLKDIDCQEDLHVVINIFSRISSEIRNLILQLIDQKRKIATSLVKVLSELYQYNFYNKGSPQLHF